MSCCRLQWPRPRDAFHRCAAVRSRLLDAEALDDHDAEELLGDLLFARSPLAHDGGAQGRARADSEQVALDAVHADVGLAGVDDSHPFAHGWELFRPSAIQNHETPDVPIANLTCRGFP